jgi:hypothetical protein
MVIYTAEPDSPSADALNLLASWTHPPALIDPRREHARSKED